MKPDDCVGQIKALFADFTRKLLSERALATAELFDSVALTSKYQNYYQTSIVTDVNERKSIVNPSTNSAN